MKSETFEVPIELLSPGKSTTKKDFYQKDGVKFGIEILICSKDNCFNVNFIAEHIDKPIKMTAKAEIPSMLLDKNNIREKQLSFNPIAPSNKIYFQTKVENIIKQLQINRKRSLKITIGIGPPTREDDEDEIRLKEIFQPKIKASDEDNISNNTISKTDDIKDTNTPINNIKTNYNATSKSNYDATSKSNTNKNSNSSYGSSVTNNYDKYDYKNKDNEKLFNKNPSKYDYKDDDDDDSYKKHRKSIDADIDNPKYMGLYNQGATCYINSAIQSFFHLPIFRRIIYDIPTDDETDQEHSLPLNLQCLFYNLQIAKSTCSTKMLTTSLGFERNDVFYQQDIEEFIKKIITTLDDTLKKIPNMKDRISSVFEGKTIQLIKDTSLKELSQSEDIFFDVSVDVKSSLEDSLKRFTKAEHIPDYTSSSSPRPQPVTYQTFFLHLPQVLFIYIKRYKYNLALNLAEKIDSKMTYSEDLDMAPYMYEKSPKQCTKYKLYGVIVHSGGASGGHYYIYCKPELKDEWYEFNDTTVQIVRSKEAIERNFGGDDISIYGYSYTWKKDYSAYMLIYVRQDAISEVFKPIDINQIPKSVIQYSEDVSKNELKRGKSDPLLQISFTVYNEKCLYENCKIGITSVVNKKYCINVTADKRSNAEELYQDIANQMKINIDCLRLWVISSNGTTFKEVLKKEKRLDSIRVQNLFAQIKDAKEKLELDYDTNVYFLLLYTPSRVKPFFFIQSKKYKTTLLKYNKIMEDAASILSSDIASKINIKYVSIYIINKQALQQKQEYSSVYEDSGTIMIIQIDDPRVSIDDDYLSGLKKKIRKDLYFDNIPGNEETETDTPISFIDYMHNRHPKDVTEYFELRNDIRKARIYNYSDISQYKGTIEFPNNVKRSKLTEFIKIAFDIKFDDGKETLLLFGREDNAAIPKSKPFNIGTKNIYMDNLESIYYCISTKAAANDRTSETRVIQLSKDAFSIAKVVCYYMPDSDVYPIQAFKVLNYNFLGDNPRMFVVDQNNSAGPIIKDTQGDGIEINNKNKLRIEIIPDDQINKELILIYKTFVDGYRIQTFEQPFYFSYIPDEPVAAFKKRITAFLKLTKDFKVHKKTFNYYSDTYLLKDKIHFESYDKERTLFLIFDID